MNNDTFKSIKQSIAITNAAMLIGLGLIGLSIVYAVWTDKPLPNPDLTGKCAIYLDGYGQYTEKCGE